MLNSQEIIRLGKTGQNATDNKSVYVKWVELDLLLDRLKKENELCELAGYYDEDLNAKISHLTKLFYYYKGLIDNTHCPYSYV